MKKAFNNNRRGFTLIELVISIAILAIIMGIAIPSYLAQVTKTHRAEGKSTLMQAAQALERCYTRFSAYNDANCVAFGQLNGSTGMLSENGHYRVTLVTPNNRPATTFTLQAVPQNSADSNQATRDKWCGTFTLEDTGQKGMTDVPDGGWSSDRCWN